MSVAKPMSDYDKKWEAEDDVRALQRIAEMKSDPARMKAAEKMLDDKMKDLESAKKQFPHNERREELKRKGKL